MPARSAAWRAALAALLLAACLPVTRPVVKIGLVAPFEGRYREIGQEIIYAVRLAVREANLAGGLAGYSVELVALDDVGDPERAVEQARKLSADPQVMAVLGHWREATTLAAAPEYAGAGLPLLAVGAGGHLPDTTYRLWPAAEQAYAPPLDRPRCPLPCDSLEDLTWLTGMLAISPSLTLAGPPLWSSLQFARLAGSAAPAVRIHAPMALASGSTDPTFSDRYQRLSPGTSPRLYAVLAYDAARVLLQAIARDLRAHAGASRAGVQAALAQTELQGLSGPIAFDSHGNWLGMEMRLYRWEMGGAEVVLVPAVP